MRPGDMEQIEDDKSDGDAKSIFAIGAALALLIGGAMMLAGMYIGFNGCGA